MKFWRRLQMHACSCGLTQQAVSPPPGKEWVDKGPVVLSAGRPPRFHEDGSFWQTRRKWTQEANGRHNPALGRPRAPMAAVMK